MKSPLFQLVTSGVALGLMCGAVTIHAVHVMGARQLTGNGQWIAGDGSGLDSVEGAKIVPASDSGGKNQLPVSGSRDEDTATLQALREIVARLQELKSENTELQGANRELQEQLEETNRDLSELQFRVDTHSESFRPLRASSGIGSILRNSISPGNTLHPLLPPKE